MIRGTGIDSTVKLYLKGNGADGSTKVYDDSQDRRVVTAYGNNDISNANSKFGRSSLYNETGKANYFSIPDSSDFDLSATDFSISFFVHMVSTPPAGTQILICKQNAASPYYGWSLGILTSSIVVYVDGGTKAQAKGVSFSATGFDWVCITKTVGENYKLFFNGVDVTSNTATTTPSINAMPVYIGNVAISSDWDSNISTYIEDLVIQHIAIDGTKVPTRQRG